MCGRGLAMEKGKQRDQQQRRYSRYESRHEGGSKAKTTVYRKRIVLPTAPNPHYGRGCRLEKQGHWIVCSVADHAEVRTLGRRMWTQKKKGTAA